MGGICYCITIIGVSMKNISELINKHEEIYGDLTQSVTYLSRNEPLPTMVTVRMSQEEKRKKQKRDWYHENREKVLEQQKNFKKKKQQKEWYANNRVQQIDKAKKWNKENKGARKLITERYKQKGQQCQWTSKNHR